PKAQPLVTPTPTDFYTTSGTPPPNTAGDGTNYEPLDATPMPSSAPNLAPTAAPTAAPRPAPTDAAQGPQAKATP
ncbi:MAG TPA: calcium-binding protein, partial [Candidatus Dormibacteraeota bacterium]|nr:calcium-binding protein [Candidatus Dormibacteraeota bacterium]